MPETKSLFAGGILLVAIAIAIIVPFVSHFGLNKLCGKATEGEVSRVGLELEDMHSSALFSGGAAAAIARPVSAPVRVKAIYRTSVDEQTPNSMAASGPKWAQKTVTLPPLRRGCHLVTPKILKEIGQDLSEFNCGLAHLFLQHTSASLTINENYDSDVRDDTETFLNKIVPEGRSAPWKHTLEGPDDMPAHIKSSMFGCALTIPITNGKLNLGTWQGIWLCEHRDAPTPRKVVITLNGN